MDNELRSLRGKASGNATMRIDTHPIFQRISGIDGNRTTELFENISIMKLFLQEKFEFDYNKERQHFSKVRAELFERYYQEELKKLVQKEETARMAVEEGKRLIVQNLVPFVGVGDGKRMKWEDRIIDDLTQQETPNILTMVLEVAPSLGDIQCIVKPEKYLEWLTNSFANHEIVWEQERKQLSERQKEDHVEKTFKVVITCKPVLTP